MRFINLPVLQERNCCCDKEECENYSENSCLFAVTRSYRGMLNTHILYAEIIVDDENGLFLVEHKEVWELWGRPGLWNHKLKYKAGKVPNLRRLYEYKQIPPESSKSSKSGVIWRGVLIF